MTELQQQLRESIQELEQLRKVQEHTAQLQVRLRAEEKDLEVMEKMLAKEQMDVEALEREGLTTMFHKFLGDREQKLDKEREEYLRASLRFNELHKSVQLIRFELDLLLKKEQNLETVERRIATLIAFREEELMKLDPAVTLVLQGINAQVDKLHRYEAEVEEAIAAGTAALEFVRGAEHYLNEAQIMGQRDMWGSRRYGYGIGQMKHEAIDHARNMAYQSKQALIRFGHEVRDVFKDTPLQFNMEIEEFGRFADVFFDNIITDYLVQSKISKSLNTVSGTRMQVDSIMASLNNERNIIREKLDKLEMERKKVVITS